MASKLNLLNAPISRSTKITLMVLPLEEKIIMTPHGFIEDTDKDLKKYKDDHAAEWSKILGGGNFDIIEESDVIEPTSIYEQEPE
jgi:hypothetical protein